MLHTNPCASFQPDRLELDQAYLWEVFSTICTATGLETRLRCLSAASAARARCVPHSFSSWWALLNKTSRPAASLLSEDVFVSSPLSLWSSSAEEEKVWLWAWVLFHRTVKTRRNVYRDENFCTKRSSFWHLLLALLHSHCYFGVFSHFWQPGYLSRELSLCWPGWPAFMEGFHL